MDRKTNKAIEELRDASSQAAEILQGLRKREGASKRLVADLEKLAKGYDKEILAVIHGIGVK